MPLKPIPGPLVSCVQSDNAYEYLSRRPPAAKAMLWMADIISVGDSRVMAGIAPAAYADALRLRGTNLACPIGYGGELTQLLPAIHAYKPRKLVVALSPLALANNPRTDAPAPESGWTMTRRILDSSLNLAGDRIASRFVRQAGVAQGTAIEVSPYFFDPVHMWTAAYGQPHGASQTVQLTEWQLMVHQERRYKNLQVLGTMLQDFRRKGWHIVCVRMPIAPEVLAIEEKYFPSATFNRWCAAHRFRYLDYSKTPFQTSDGSHLTADEAIRFTRLLATDVHAKAGW